MNKKFKIGDKIKVYHKPADKDLAKWPVWTDEMNRWEKKIMTISEYTYDYKGVRVLENGFTWHVDWMEKEMIINDLLGNDLFEL